MREGERDTVGDTVVETVTHTTFYGAPLKTASTYNALTLVVGFQGTERSDSYESIAELMYSLNSSEEFDFLRPNLLSERVTALTDGLNENT
jgi:hypothetical protein